MDTWRNRNAQTIVEQIAGDPASDLPQDAAWNNDGYRGHWGTKETLQCEFQLLLFLCRDFFFPLLFYQSLIWRLTLLLLLNKCKVEDTFIIYLLFLIIVYEVVHLSPVYFFIWLN